MKYLLCLIVIFISGCGSTFNDSMTPDPKLVRSDFDNSIEVYQSNVSSAQGLGEEWTTIGLFWTDRAKDVVVVRAGIAGISAIANIAFNADGKIFEYHQTTTALTQFDTNEFLDWSHKSFVVPKDEFEFIANAETVKFKVTRIDNTYGVSTFGKNHPRAIITSKIPKFMLLVNNS